MALKLPHTRAPGRAGRRLCRALLGLAGVGVGTAYAQDYRFPAGDEHYGYFYPTAYMDEGGRDWNCGSIYYSGHTGSDYGVGSWAGMDAGRRVVAAADGVVIATNDGEYDRCETADCGEANYVILEHENGRRTWYWHLKQWSVAVSPGQVVTCGTHLGEVGSSGNSTGPHLHFEVREASGSAGDPFDGPCSAPPTYWIAQGDYGGLPGNTCPSSGPCVQVGSLSCGQAIASTNDSAGATATHGVYGCGPSTSSGPEIAYAFSTPLDEPVTLQLTGLGADLDLFVLSSDACDGNGAVTCSTNAETSDESLQFDASAGTVYTVVVDGWEGAVSGFSLAAICTGVVSDGGTDSGPGDSGSTPTDAGGADTDPTDADGGATPDDLSGDRPGARVPFTEGGCGCNSPASGPGPGPWAWAPLGVGLALARRRRRGSPR